MIDKLAELNRVLLAVQAVKDEQGTALFDAVVRQCESVVVESRMPDHVQTIEFAHQVQLVEHKGNEVRITPAGLDFISLNPTNAYDLLPEQARLLIRACYLHGALRQQTHKMLRGFEASSDTYRWSEIDSPALEVEAWLLVHLEQLGLLRRTEAGYEVTPEHVSTISEFLAEGKGFTEAEFEAWLAEKKEIGSLAEELVLDYEAKRLRDQGFVMESRCVRRISKVRVNAGYDIESYDGKAPKNLNFDRFIEVKASRDPKVRFFWSANEIEIAKKLGDKYWIYYQGGIDLKGKRAKNKPLLFRNPIESILKNAQFKVSQHSVRVEAGLRGEDLVVVA